MPDHPRVQAHGKQVMLDGRHLADAVSEGAAEAIAIALNYLDPVNIEQGNWLGGDDLDKLDRLYA